MKNALYLAGAMILTLPLSLATVATAEVVKLQASLKGSNDLSVPAAS